MKKMILPAFVLTLFVACQHAKENSNTQNESSNATFEAKMNTASVIEITDFQLVKGTTDAQLADAVKRMNDSFLVHQTGFILRNLSKKNDSVWTDVIFWKDTTAINMAMNASQNSTAVLPFFQLIDMTNVKMERVNPVYRFSNK